MYKDYLGNLFFFVTFGQNLKRSLNMNRKQLLTTCLLIMSAFAGNVTADNKDNVAVNVDLVDKGQNRIYIDLRVFYENPIEKGTGIGRSPMQIPSIYMDGHTVYLDGYSFDEIQLVAKYENGDSYTVYSSEVLESAETVEIPNGFAGEYEIRLYRGGYYFYGDIVI